MRVAVLICILGTALSVSLPTRAEDKTVVTFIPAIEGEGSLDGPLPASQAFELQTPAPESPARLLTGGTLRLWAKTGADCAEDSHKQSYSLALNVRGTGAERVLFAKVPPLQVGQAFCIRLNPALAVSENQMSALSDKLRKKLLVEDLCKALASHQALSAFLAPIFDKELQNAGLAEVSGKTEATKALATELLATLPSSCDGLYRDEAVVAETAREVEAAGKLFEDALEKAKARANALSPPRELYLLLGKTGQRKAVSTNDATKRWGAEKDALKAAADLWLPDAFRAPEDREKLRAWIASRVKPPKADKAPPPPETLYLLDRSGNLRAVTALLSDLSLQASSDDWKSQCETVRDDAGWRDLDSFCMDLRNLVKADEKKSDTIVAAKNAVEARNSTLLLIEDELKKGIMSPSTRATLRTTLTLSSESSRARDAKTPAAGNYFSPDVGVVVAFPMVKHVQTPWLVPYYGLSVYLTQVDRTVPLDQLVGAFKQRFSFTVGLSAKSPVIDGRALNPVLLGAYPMVAAGYRLSPFSKLSLGSFVFWLADANPASRGQTFCWAPFLALSVDADVLALIKQP